MQDFQDAVRPGGDWGLEKKKNKNHLDPRGKKANRCSTMEAGHARGWMGFFRTFCGPLLVKSEYRFFPRGDVGRP